MNIPQWAIIHHSGGSDSAPLADSSNYTVKQCDADHKIRFPHMKSSLGWYVGYTYFIDKKGIVTQTRNENEEGAHTVGYNSKSIGICLAGNFDATLPTKEQEQALQVLIAPIMARYPAITVDKIVPHRKFASKTCFGRKLSDDWAQKLMVEKPTVASTIAPVDAVSCENYIKAQDSTTIISWIQRLFGFVRNK